MNYNNDVEIFLEELKRFIKEKSGLRESSGNIYSGKIKKILESGYSVADLCGSVDRLLEDYSVGGKRYDKRDHGKTKSALDQVRKMIKGDIISSLYVSYEKGSCSWSRTDPHVIKYYIKDEKITFYLNTNKKYVKKIGPVNVGKLIYILQEAEKQGFLCDDGILVYTKSSPLIFDAPSPSKYEYSIDGSSGICYNSLLDDSKSSMRTMLQDQYDNLINQLIAPYDL